MSDRRAIRRRRAVLGLVDGAVIFGAFAITFAGFRRFDAVGVVLNSLGAALIGVVAMHVEGLWLERVIAIRWAELAKLSRVTAVLFVGALALDRVPGSPITLVSALVGCAVSWVALIVWRSIHRSWLRLRWARGRDALRVLVVGSDRRTMEVIRTFDVQPDAGMQVVGIVGAEDKVRAAGRGGLWLGELADLDAVLDRTPTDCALVGSTDEVGPDILDRLLLTEPDVYAVPVRGGIAARRVSTTAFANETLLHVDPVQLTPVALGIKRTFDVLVSVLLIIVTSPLLAVIALGDQAGRRSGPLSADARRSR